MMQNKAVKNYKSAAEMIAGTKGHTLTELILVVAMLGLFGMATFTLVISSSTAYKKIMEKSNVDSELRIAISYLDTKLKHNDSSGAVRLEPNPLGEGNAFVITETFEDGTYETWIYQNGGKLKEMTLAQDDTFQDELSFEIADIEGLDAGYDKSSGLVKVKVWASAQDGKRELETYIAMKSGIS
ncbi:MAG: DUF4860 domain-containing protein [Clostridiales bacterium]|nr:DUF4860 domain-containing protein [Clostridiales bacterium]